MEACLVSIRRAGAVKDAAKQILPLSCSLSCLSIQETRGSVSSPYVWGPGTRLVTRCCARRTPVLVPILSLTQTWPRPAGGPVVPAPNAIHHQPSRPHSSALLMLSLPSWPTTFLCCFRIVVLAGDTLPIEVYCHIPVMCEDRSLPYAYIPSKTVRQVGGV